MHTFFHLSSHGNYIFFISNLASAINNWTFSISERVEKKMTYGSLRVKENQTRKNPRLKPEYNSRVTNIKTQTYFRFEAA
jgi:hypothetical protein